MTYRDSGHLQKNLPLVNSHQLQIESLQVPELTDPAEKAKEKNASSIEFQLPLLQQPQEKAPQWQKNV